MSALAAEHDDVLPGSEDFDLRDHMDGIAAFIAGPANVILQLGHPAVGHGVVTKPRPEGSVMKHPFKRLRTTFSYLAVAMIGDEQDTRAMREAVNFSHRGVRSDPGSTPTFNAFDPRLQLWVAGCIYWGYVDSLEKLRGPIDDQTKDRIYRESVRFGTTLQMPAEMWPATRSEFDAYFQAGLDEIHFDPIVRDYLLKLLRFKQLHPVMRLGAGQFMTWSNTGFLPPEVRRALGLEWSGRDDLLFTLLMRSIGFGYKVLPRPARNFPFNFFLWDVRRRVRTGRPIV
ncbi:MAG TPA: oxygenase MpaB family protein [Nocardioidaceae bacterium]|nr:oxygenase MpaB family protein [Nocardioidaceae bacterium]